MSMCSRHLTRLRGFLYTRRNVARRKPRCRMSQVSPRIRLLSRHHPLLRTCLTTLLLQEKRTNVSTPRRSARLRTGWKTPGTSAEAPLRRRIKPRFLGRNHPAIASAAAGYSGIEPGLFTPIRLTLVTCRVGTERVSAVSVDCREKVDDWKHRRPVCCRWRAPFLRATLRDHWPCRGTLRQPFTRLAGVINPLRTRKQPGGAIPAHRRPQRLSQAAGAVRCVPGGPQGATGTAGAYVPIRTRSTPAAFGFR